MVFNLHLGKRPLVAVGRQLLSTRDHAQWCIAQHGAEDGRVEEDAGRFRGRRARLLREVLQLLLLLTLQLVPPARHFRSQLRDEVGRQHLDQLLHANKHFT